MNGKRTTFSELAGNFLSRMRDFLEKRKRIKDALIGLIVGLIFWNIFYFSNKWLPRGVSLIVVLLVFLISILLFFGKSDHSS